jgi:hypothetical protein
VRCWRVRGSAHQSGAADRVGKAAEASFNATDRIMYSSARQSTHWHDYFNGSRTLRLTCCTTFYIQIPIMTRCARSLQWRPGVFNDLPAFAALSSSGHRRVPAKAHQILKR